ncbi:hypothetical protein [Deinococcus peraridilitoris]|uniref:Uncharacterized protein n=1 Tax=Deinococcus peraridilitoris (strain DSM 19664 / LMG 22246 / CIP 109416 / KR-200) TaxID=937777 RepID=K9ZY53_DEIPD|nr:hypothetical protein [Deinococcus peraridilitoris]AFZ65670.1 hypothetical protein Deipe_0062 [Deinococcus peraridilitoris DSM 19664]
MNDLEVHGGELRIGTHLRSRALVELLFPGAQGDVVRTVPIDVSQRLDDGGWRLRGAAHDFEVTATWALQQGQHCAYTNVELVVRSTAASVQACAVRVRFELTGMGTPTWLIPGAFYKENRLAHCTRIYPRYDPEGGDAQQLVSASWSFRSDRAALPAVFAWTTEGCAALATTEESAVGMTGVGFAGSANERAIWLNFPYREEPVVFLAPDTPGPPERPVFHFQRDAPMTLHFRVYLAGPDLHAYNPLVRELYELERHDHPLNPWMNTREAAELTAHGLFTWHYHPEEALLYETAAFDREGGKADRPNMHVGWVSGAPYAHALLTYGRAHNRPEYTQAAISVLDKISTGVAPAGMFWGEWRHDRGWSHGWTPHKGWIQARTISECTLFMLHALAAEKNLGVQHDHWRWAVQSNLDYVLSIQRADGSFGQYYAAESGEVMEWEGAGGLLWISALLHAARSFDVPSYRAAAVRAGEYYRAFVEDEFIYGAPEDVHLCPTSEDGYNAVMAFVHLYEDTRDERWLKLACRAADWTMTFRWTYNLRFPERSFLKQFAFASRGADQASPSNQHLHNYGLICLPEMLRLWTHTKDAYYLERTRDNLACFLQFVAREDGDFNAYKGMVTERYYNTNCFQSKGMLLTQSHAWSVGAVLYACQAVEGWPGTSTPDDLKVIARAGESV